jgi:hypothetical protein
MALIIRAALRYCRLLTPVLDYTIESNCCATCLLLMAGTARQMLRESEKEFI